MTGMPTFGSTHSKDELWGMVVFVKRLPNLKPEYVRMGKQPVCTKKEKMTIIIAE